MNQPKVNLLRNELRHHGSKCIAVPLSGHHAAVFLPKRQKPSPSNKLASVEFERVVHNLDRLKLDCQTCLLGKRQGFRYKDMSNYVSNIYVAECISMQNPPL